MVELKDPVRVFDPTVLAALSLFEAHNEGVSLLDILLGSSTKLSFVLLVVLLAQFFLHLLRTYLTT